LNGLAGSWKGQYEWLDFEVPSSRGGSFSSASAPVSVKGALAVQTCFVTPFSKKRKPAGRHNFLQIIITKRDAGEVL
jgi:hypothetical protein